MVATGFFQTLLDLTVEEALIKYGFRYATAEDWGRLRRLFVRALQLKLAGGLLAGVALLALAPFAEQIFGTEGLALPSRARRCLPLVQAPENVAGTRDSAARPLRPPRRAADAVDGAPARGDRGRRAVRPDGDDRRDPGRAGARDRRRDRCRRGGVSPLPGCSRRVARRPTARAFARSCSSRARRRGCSRCGRHSRRSCSGSSPVRCRSVCFRVAQAPQAGYAALSSPVRMIMLTEQTRDWERGEIARVLDGVRRYTRVRRCSRWSRCRAASARDADLIEVVFGAKYLGARRRRPARARRRVDPARARLDEVVPGLDRAAQSAPRSPTASRRSC